MIPIVGKYVTGDNQTELTYNNIKKNAVWNAPTPYAFWMKVVAKKCLYNGDVSYFAA